MHTDKRIDTYIAKSADFAKPILTHLRGVIHDACPDVMETMKWSFPHFDYKGSILCSMAAFKQHCAFGFWLGSLMKDPKKILTPVGERTAMGHLGQIKSVDDLPPVKILIQYTKEAMKLIDGGAKLTKQSSPSSPKTIEVPDYFLKLLKKNKKALSTYESFSYTNKKDYVDWITEAKTEDTRSKRMANAIEWMEEGKIRNWKYMKS